MVTHAARRVFLVGTPANEASVALVSEWRGRGVDAELCPARIAAAAALPGDVVLGRLDVLPTLDGIEPGLFDLWRIERGGATVLNGAEVLLATHDKLRTNRLLAKAGLPHPQTAVLDPSASIALPAVVKPRFGSWGRDVFLCETEPQLRACLDAVRERPWFKRHGALVQSAAPRLGWDVRALVAAGRIVGAAIRRAAAGEWRTNVSLGGTSYPIRLDEEASELARTAAAAVGADLVGVDLLPLPDGSYLVLELNGATEFDPTYVQSGNVYEAVGHALSVLDPRGQPVAA